MGPAAARTTADRAAFGASATADACPDAGDVPAAPRVVPLFAARLIAASEIVTESAA